MQIIPIDQPRIVLTWLTRLRWLAVVGQLVAVLVAVAALKIELPLVPIGLVIGLTAVSNLALQYRGPTAGAWLMPAVVLIDVVLLTAILMLTGGTDNPFCTLYVVHVVLAVILLGSFWTWVVVSMAAMGFAALSRFHIELDPVGNPLPNWARVLGPWLSLVLVTVLIAYFIGRLHRELRDRASELAGVRERAERSARFAALTALAAGAAHELGSPLGTIAIVAKELELNAQKSGAAPDLVDDTQLIRTEVDRCRAILARMRLEVGEDLHYEARTVTADEFIEGAIADLTEDRKQRVRRFVDVGAERFHLSSRAILRGVGVLLRNGFEASPEGSPVELHLSRGGGKVSICVRDFGHGMPPDVLKRAGEPFFTTKEMGRGMGMGLFLVKLVVDNHDGRLILASGTGKGTQATIEMPDLTGPNPSSIQGASS
jgi:two-component system, sensor histidine kinase RegB